MKDIFDLVLRVKSLNQPNWEKDLFCLEGHKKECVTVNDKNVFPTHISMKTS